MTRKRLAIAASAIAGLFLLIVLAIPFVVDANQFRPTVEADLASALGRKVTIGHLKVALLSGGISIDDLAVAEDPAFGSAPFLTAKTVDVGVEWLPLLFSKQVRIQSFRLVEPQVVVRRSAPGLWNFSSLGGSSPSGSSANVSVHQLTMSGGRVVVAGAPELHEKSRQYDNVTLDATDLSYASAFAFRMTATMPGNGAVTVQGKAGPFNSSNAAETAFHATLTVSHLDLASSGVNDPASGMAGLVDVTAELQSDGRKMSARGTLRASKFQLVMGGAPARVPVEIAYASDYDMKTGHGVVTEGDVHVGKAVATLTGGYNTGGATTAVQLTLAGHKMPAPELEATLPAIGVTLPAGASLEGGTVDADLVISGPIDRLVTAGPIRLSDAKVKSFDLSRKMGVIASLTGLPGSADTLIQTFSSTVHIAPDGTRADSLNLIVAAIGNLTGNGTIAPNGTLNFRMLAKVNSAAASIPFRVAGTTANPVFMPDVFGIAASLASSPEAATAVGGLLGGLLNGKP